MSFHVGSNQFFGTLGSAHSIINSSAPTYTRKWDCKRGSRFSCHFVWTGTAISEITLWRSNLPNPNETDDNDWVLVGLNVSIESPGGGDGKSFYCFGNVGALWYRAKVVTTEGESQISCYLFRKA